jgi:N-methylhydantoinase A
LVDKGVEAIAICFLWSVRNADHEARAAEIVREAFPSLFVSVSHDVAPTAGEYERFITAAIDAYVGPRLATFLARLDEALRDNGFTGELLVSQSDGASLYANETKPAYTLQSGPAAGIIASKTEGDLLGYPNIVTADVGGTSFDVGLVADGQWVSAHEPVVDSFHVSFPMIEVESIGAGGGSIAWRDEGGALVVGPQSAGSEPGPACYGRGGTQPTVTDAAVVLGYINPDAFLGGRLTLDPSLAERAVGELADSIGLDLISTASGIFEIANTHMSSLVTRRVLSRGYDPRDFVLFTYGGAGPVHAAFYASEIGVSKVVVPALAGTFSALGVAAGPMHHSARSTEFAAMPMPVEAFNAQFDDLAQAVSKRLERDTSDPAKRRLTFGVDMRYGVQVHTVRLPLEAKRFEERDIDEASEAFDALYERLFGRGSGFVDAGRYVTGFVVDGFADAPVPDRAGGVSVVTDAEAPSHVGERQAYFNGEMTTTAVHHYERMAVGETVHGPAVLDAPTTTIVVPPGHEAFLDEFRNVHIQSSTDGE